MQKSEEELYFDKAKWSETLAPVISLWKVLMKKL